MPQIFPQLMASPGIASPTPAPTLSPEQEKAFQLWRQAQLANFMRIFSQTYKNVPHPTNDQGQPQPYAKPFSVLRAFQDPAYQQAQREQFLKQYTQPQQR